MKKIWIREYTNKDLDPLFFTKYKSPKTDKMFRFYIGIMIPQKNAWTNYWGGTKIEAPAEGKAKDRLLEPWEIVKYKVLGII